MTDPAGDPGETAQEIADNARNEAQAQAVVDAVHARTHDEDGQPVAIVVPEPELDI